MIKQIRIYTINRGYLEQFADEWNRNVVPLRAEHGFEVLEAWLFKETNQFVWLLGYSGKRSWSEAEAAYYAYTGILLAWEKPFSKEKPLDYQFHRSFWRILPRSDGHISSSQANIGGRKSAKCLRVSFRPQPEQTPLRLMDIRGF